MEKLQNELHIDRGEVKYEIPMEVFRKSVKICKIIVEENKCNEIIKLVKAFIIKIPKFKCVLASDDGKKRIIICNFDLMSDDNAIKCIKDVTNGMISIEEDHIEIKYENVNLKEAYDILLPQDVPHPVSTQIIGHIAHFNLRTYHLPYKYMIGEIFLSKNPTIRTVVNKLKSIDNKFRNAELELIAGVSDFDVCVSEQKCRFKFNYQKVYWNSKLSDEHTRIVEIVSRKPKGVIVDLFCGVGPFSIPLAKKQFTLLSNDANPESVNALFQNAKLNKVTNNIIGFCNDAKVFLERMSETLEKLKTDDLVLNKEFYSLNTKTGIRIQAIIMNLPAIALDFLPYLENSLHAKDDCFIVDVDIYCYCFIRNSDDSEKELPPFTYTPSHVIKKVKNAFSLLKPINIELVYVRKVAPNKSMYCAQFKLTSINVRDDVNGEIPVNKRSRKGIEDVDKEFLFKRKKYENQ